MAQDTVIDDLIRLLGPEGVLLGKDVSDRYDGWPPITPVEARCIARPNSTEQVAAVLHYCNDAGIAVVPQGGRTGLSKGARTARTDVALSLERLNRIQTIDTLGATMTVEAGVPLCKVQEAAESAGLFYPVDIGSRGSATIGGTIATNAGGNRVIRFGMTREQVLGVEAVLADGTVLSSMNCLLKNNAGYDLKQLFIGSEGTLGVVTRTVLKLRPRLAPSATAFVGTEKFDHVLAILHRMTEATHGTLSSFEVMWSEFVDTVLAHSQHQRPLQAKHAFYVLLEVAAPEAQELLTTAMGSIWGEGIISDAIVATSEAQAAAFWAIREDFSARKAALTPAMHFDIGLPRTAMESYVDSVRAQLCMRWPGMRLLVFGHVGDCNLHLTVGVGHDDTASRHLVEEIVYGSLRALGGSITAEHGIGLEKRGYIDVSRTAGEVALMRKLKSVLDPRQTLNPGKVIRMPGID